MNKTNMDIQIEKGRKEAIKKQQNKEQTKEEKKENNHHTYIQTDRHR